MHSVNRHIIMGNIIVPAQPFGYNYPKLIELLCCSHEIRERDGEVSGVQHRILRDYLPLWFNQGYVNVRWDEAYPQRLR